jgi:hypothetical protein
MPKLERELDGVLKLLIDGLGAQKTRKVGGQAD